MVIASCKSDETPYTFLPSMTEVIWSIFFLLAWLFPVIASWLVALSGLRFSYVGQNWQLSNIDVVGYSIALSLFSGVISAIIVLIVMSCTLKLSRQLDTKKRLHRTQLLFIMVIALLSGVGVFKSFGGTVFDKAYSGPTTAWLGYGAWSVTYSISLSILVGELLLGRFALGVVILFVTLAYIPLLLCGSRIDYVSLMLGLSCYIYCVSRDGLWVRLFKSVVIVAIAISVYFFVGNIRYQNFKIPEDLSQALLGMGLKSSKHVQEEKIDMLYLSTVGDVGASFFQVVGLIENGAFTKVGATKAVDNYLERLLPGPFFKDRPGDLSGLLPEPIAGGTLHSLGEGYLIAGYVGCVFISAIFGTIAAASIFFVRYLKYAWAPTLFVVFLFPLLLLIRGGWYQIFSIFKSLEIFLIICACLTAVRYLKNNFLARICRG